MGDKRNFKKYLYRLLKCIPTFNITGISDDRYSYYVEINSHVLNERYMNGTIDDKLTNILKNCHKIEHLKYNGYSEDYQNTKYIIEFKK